MQFLDLSKGLFFRFSALAAQIKQHHLLGKIARAVASFNVYNVLFIPQTLRGVESALVFMRL